jgi:hypothetical protein
VPEDYELRTRCISRYRRYMDCRNTFGSHRGWSGSDDSVVSVESDIGGREEGSELDPAAGSSVRLD